MGAQLLHMNKKSILLVLAGLALALLLRNRIPESVKQYFPAL